MLLTYRAAFGDVEVLGDIDQRRNARVLQHLPVGEHRLLQRLVVVERTLDSHALLTQDLALGHLLQQHRLRRIILLGESAGVEGAEHVQCRLLFLRMLRHHAEGLGKEVLHPLEEGLHLGANAQHGRAVVVACLPELVHVGGGFFTRSLTLRCGRVFLPQRFELLERTFVVGHLFLRSLRTASTDRPASDQAASVY